MSYTAKSVIFDIADNWDGNITWNNIRAIDFYLAGVKIDNIASTDFVAYVTSNYSGYSPQFAFDTSFSKIGVASSVSWQSNINNGVNQRLICVFNTETEFDEIRIVNCHWEGLNTGRGAKNVQINTSSDAITSTVYDEAIANSTLIFDSTFAEHSAVDEPDEQTLALIVPTYTAKSIIIDITNHYGNSTFAGIRSVEFYLAGVLIPNLVTTNFVSYSTSVVGTRYDEEQAFDTSVSKIGSYLDNQFMTGNLEYNDQRVVCVFNTPIEFDSIVINNAHNSGTDTNMGVKDCLIYLSTDAITSIVYGETIAYSHLLFDGTLDEHVATNTVDDQSLTLFEIPTYTAKSVILDVADNYGSTFAGIRSIDFYLDDVLVDNIVTTDFVSYQTSSSGAGYYAEYAFTTTTSKVGSSTSTGWLSGNGQESEQRLICLLNTDIEFDKVVVNNYHDSGGLTDRGAKNIKLSISTETVTSTVYDEVLPGSILLFDGILDEHVATNTQDDQILDIVAVTPTYTAKSVVFDFLDNWGELTYMSVRQIDFYLAGVKIANIPTTNFVSYATSNLGSTLDKDNAFDTSTLYTGDNANDSWYTLGAEYANIRLICVFDSPTEFDSIVINNAHNSGTQTNMGVKNTKIYFSSDEIISTVYDETVPNSVLIFDSVVTEHPATDTQEDEVLILLNSTIPETLYTAKSIIFDIADGYGDASYVGLRSVELYLDGVLHEMLEGVDFIAYATTFEGFTFDPQQLFDTSKLKTGGYGGTQWMCTGGNTTEQRVTCVFGTELVFDTLVINNAHNRGTETDQGSQNVKILIAQGSVTSTVYDELIAESTLIFDGILDEHTAVDEADDQVIDISSGLTVYTGRSVVLDIADNHGDASYMGLRSIEFYHGGVLVDTVYADGDFEGYATNSAGASYLPRYAIDTTISKTGTVTLQGWLSGTGVVNKRFIVGFVADTTFDAIVINNYHDSGAQPTRGIKTFKINVSTDVITSTVYDEAIANSTQIFDGVIDQHPATNTVDDQNLFLEEPLPEATYTAKSVIIDIADNYGDLNYVSIRSVDFLRGGFKIANLETTDFVAYATTDEGSSFDAPQSFDTSKLKTGGYGGTQWLCASPNYTNQRLICVFNAETGFDSIVINNAHSSGGSITMGSQNVKINVSTDAITSTVYDEAIANSALIYDGVFRIHVAANVEDEEILTLIAPGGEGTALEDMALDIQLYQDFLEDAKLDISIAGEGLDDLKLDLSAYYQGLEDLNIDISVMGDVIQDMPMALAVAGFHTEDASLDLASFYQAVIDAKLDLDLAALMLQDSTLDLYTAYQILEDAKLDLRTAIEFLQNGKLDLQLGDGIVLSDGQLDISVNDGITLADMGLSLSVGRMAPSYKANYAIHLQSAISTIT